MLVQNTRKLGTLLLRMHGEEHFIKPIQIDTTLIRARSLERAASPDLSQCCSTTLQLKDESFSWLERTLCRNTTTPACSATKNCWPTSFGSYDKLWNVWNTRQSRHVSMREGVWLRDWGSCMLDLSPCSGLSRHLAQLHTKQTRLHTNTTGSANSALTLSFSLSISRSLSLSLCFVSICPFLSFEFIFLHSLCSYP